MLKKSGACWAGGAQDTTSWNKGYPFINVHQYSRYVNIIYVSQELWFLREFCYCTNCVTYRKLDSSGLYFTGQIGNRIGGFGQIGLSAGVVYISSQKVKNCGS